MAISEGESARTIVIGGGDVTPSRGGPAHNKKRVIDRVRMFIQGDPGHDRRLKVHLLKVLSVRLVGPSLPGSVIITIRTAPANQGIHGVASQALAPASRPLDWA